MNIAQQLYESAQQYGAKLELNEGQGLRLNHADHVPDALITQIRQFKPEIIQYLQQCAISDLIDSIYQYGANIEVIDGQQLRLDHAYHIPDQLITQIKQLKPQILAYLTPSTEQDQQGQAQLRDFEHQLVQVFFDRLDHKRQNLRKINGSIQNALVTPKDYMGDLMGKLGIQQYQAQSYLDNMIGQGMFNYDSRFKFYLFPNYDHSAIQPFSHYNLDKLQP